MVRFLLAILFLTGCTFPFGPDRSLLLSDAQIFKDTVWQGRVVIDGSVKVFKGATLTILPGTEISFVKKDLDRDGLGDGTLIVEGALHAEGTHHAPIHFRSAATDPQPGDWLEIRVDFSKDALLRYCEINDSAYTLHAHFTKGVMEDCTIRGNIDGSRLGESDFAIRNCLIEKNIGKGINFRNATVELARNIIRYNRSGIFLFENDRASSIHHNNLYGNDENFRLGDFFTGDVRLGGNWWGVPTPEDADLTVHDRKADPSIGRVWLNPSSDWIDGTGPRDALSFRQGWTHFTEGFVDAPPLVSGKTLFAGSWDGRLYALDRDGKLLWSKAMGDSVDGSMVVDETAIYLQSWSREVFAIDRCDGSQMWRFAYPPSPVDDHRQAGLTFAGDLLLVPAWNGTLYALDRKTGLLRWRHPGEGALRSAPAWDGRRIYLAGGDGTLSILDADGSVLKKVAFDAPILTVPALTFDGCAVVTRDGRLAALDSGGMVKWTLDLGEPCYYGSPLYADGEIYLGTAGGRVLKVEAEMGRILWTVESTGPVYSTPLLVGKRLYVGDNGGTLFALNALSGDVLATFQVPREIQGSPTFSGGRLFFGARDHGIYAIDIIESSGTVSP